MISPRFVPGLCILVGLALVPTVVHRYVEVTVADGRSVAIIPSDLAGFMSVPTRRAAGWGRQKFESDDWIERKYTASGEEIVLTVVRSYDLKRLYHHPELTAARGIDLATHRTTRLSLRPAIPVHVLESPPNQGAIAMYVLHYDRRFVEDPLSFQIRTAGELLFSGRKPMTLFFVQQRGVRDGADGGGLRSAALLFAAIDSFLAQKIDASG